MNENNTYLHYKPSIGSNRLRQSLDKKSINFHLKEKIFGNFNEINPIHPNQSCHHPSNITKQYFNKVKQRKNDILEYKRSKILDATYQPWNISTKQENATALALPTRIHHVKDRSNNYQYNYRAESLDPLRNIEPIECSTKFHFSIQSPETIATIKKYQTLNPVYKGYQKRTQELPNHPKLESAIPWNHSISVNPKSLLSKDGKFMKQTKLSAQRIYNKNSNQFKTYEGPKKQQENLIESIRLHKIMDQFHINDRIQDYIP